MNKTNCKFLFDQREKLGKNVLELIKDRGYTKSSFSKLTGISRPTLDKIIKGDINNASTFSKHIRKILKTQNMTPEELLEYKSEKNHKEEFLMVASDNAPENHELNVQAKQMFDILDKVIGLYEVYFT